MQYDVGSVWRQELCWQMNEARLAAAARLPAPGPSPAGPLAAWWDAVWSWLLEVARGAVGRCLPHGARAAEANGALPEGAAGPAREGPWEEAVRCCLRALVDRSDLVGLWVGLSVAAARLGDVELAEGAYDMARTLAPEEAPRWRDALERDFPVDIPSLPQELTSTARALRQARHQMADLLDLRDGVHEGEIVVKEAASSDTDPRPPVRTGASRRP